jgi:hypothetical protein
VDTSSVQITDWIAHDVPAVKRADVATAPLELSEAVAPHSAKVATFFKARITTALADRQREIVETAGTTSPVPGQVRQLLAGGRDLVAASQILARHLRASQMGSTSSGLLVITRLSADKIPGVAILKLEPQDGARAHREVIKGKVTYVVDVLSDLVLTRGTRVFKVALFMQGDVTPAGQVKGRAADPQSGSDGDVARFFLQIFLGCELAESDEVTTRRALRASEEFFNRTITDVQKRARYQVAMLAELESNRTTINLKAFANTNLAPEDRAPFTAAMQAAEVPVQPFGKDVDLVKKHLQKVKFVFEDGTSVLTSTASMDDGKVTVEPAADAKTRLEVVERLRRLGPA